MAQLEHFDTSTVPFDEKSKLTKRTAQTGRRVITVTCSASRPSLPSLSLPNQGTNRQFAPRGIVTDTKSWQSSQSFTPVCTLKTVTTPESPEISSPAASRYSKYPRPSPPVFLYPEVIVPHAAHEERRILMQQASSGTTMKNTIWYLPYGLEVFIFTCMLLGCVWVILVCLVNFPPRTWTCFQHNGARGSKENGKATRDKRPVDKPSSAITTSAKPISMYLHGGTHLHNSTQSPQAIELKQRQQHRAQPTDTQPFTEYQRTHAPQFAVLNLTQPGPATPPLSSPPNPFLDPPNTFQQRTHSPQSPRRSSKEWLAERAAFFSTSSPVDELDECAAITTADMEALEAGTAPLTLRIGKKPGKSASWVDLGLGMVEGAVDRVVDRMVRWTDDDGGDEGLLLPIVCERRMKVE